MKEGRTVCRIIANLDKSLITAGTLEELINRLAIPALETSGGRSALLHHRRGFGTLFSQGPVLENAPVDTISLLAPVGQEETIMATMASRFSLDKPGHGSIRSETVTLYSTLRSFTETPPAAAADKTRIQTNLAGVCCIVARGNGDLMAKIALESGAAVPITRFGAGTGVRDKLGILRVTIPAEKEIVTIVTGAGDAESVMDTMIDTGKLDQPGRGFIYLFGVSKGILNTKVSRGTSNHAASIEQIITAIDEIKGTIEWRSRGTAQEKGTRNHCNYLRNLVDMTILCNEGYSNGLVTAAMSAGAAGATISKQKFIAAAATCPVSPARESCSLVVGPEQVEKILAALGRADIFGDKVLGEIVTRPVPKACTYIGR
jgi:hypothetical protein